jgi:hypothetical protein
MIDTLKEENGPGATARKTPRLPGHFIVKRVPDNHPVSRGRANLPLPLNSTPAGL